MKRSIKVLYVAAEISPYANAGGLGEVGKSFPAALLEDNDIEVRRVMPFHKCVKGKMEYLQDFPVAMGQENETCIVKIDSDSKKLPTYFIENARYFYREDIYGYQDDGIRYFFFCCAVVEMLKVIPYKPDILHANDWHTGFLPVLIKKEFPAIKTVFTIHNIAYHGYIPASYMNGKLTDTEINQLGWPEWLDFMKAGIIYADMLTTVSSGYCEEIQQPIPSSGMATLIKERTNGIVGIRNGIDTVSYNPSDERAIDYPYDIDHLGEKKKNRSLLREHYGLSDKDIPLVTMITRLDYSKGIDLLPKVLSLLKLETFQLIVLGSGSTLYQQMLSGLAEEYPGIFVADFDYSPDLAKKIYAACDIYLMPSKFEPCGLSQLYAMRYGAVPVVNPVGGLKCTVADDREHPENSTGFYMQEWDGEALAAALQRAISAYGTPSWNDYMKNGVNFDSSWKRSVTEYRKLYEELLISLESPKENNLG